MRWVGGRHLPLGYELSDFGMACAYAMASVSILQLVKRGVVNVPAKTLIEEPPSIFNGQKITR